MTAVIVAIAVAVGLKRIDSGHSEQETIVQPFESNGSGCQIIPVQHQHQVEYSLFVVATQQHNRQKKCQNDASDSFETQVRLTSTGPVLPLAVVPSLVCS